MAGGSRADPLIALGLWGLDLRVDSSGRTIHEVADSPDALGKRGRWRILDKKSADVHLQGAQQVAGRAEPGQHEGPALGQLLVQQLSRGQAIDAWRSMSTTATSGRVCRAVATI